MFNILILFAAAYLVFEAFRFNIFLGIAAFFGVLAYAYFLWYGEFCMSRAKSVYRKNPKKALVWFERAYVRGMKVNQLETYAYYLLREGETEKAKEIYDTLLNQNLSREVRFKIRTDYAVFLLKTGKIDKAIEELEDVTVNYNNTTTYGSLGYLYLLKNNRRRAQSYNLEAYDYNAQDPVILDNLTQLYIKLENYEQAKKYADELIERNPYFVESYYDAAFVYLKLNDYEKASELIAQAKTRKITFMSTINENDLNALEQAILNKDTTVSHKLGVFVGEDEEIEIPKKLIYADEEDETAEYEEPIGETDENDPFI